MANVYFGDTLGVADNNWNTSIQFAVNGITVAPTAGAIYSNNGIQFKVTSAFIFGGTGSINAGGTGTTGLEGVLTKVSGTGDATIVFYDKADVNWFLTQGSVCCTCCCSPGFNVPGTPLGRLPTLADTVIVGNTINTASYITPWSSTIVVSKTYAASNVQYAGAVNVGAFSGVVTFDGGVLGGSIFCTGSVVASGNFTDGEINGGTFNCPVSAGVLRINGGTFSSSVTVGNVSNSGFLRINGSPTFNGTIVNSRGTSTVAAAGLYVDSGTPVFNCAIPSNFTTYEMRQGVYDRALVLGLTAPTSGYGPFITIASGFSTSQNVTMNCKRTGQGYIGIYGGGFTGLLTINKLSTVQVDISGGSYSPPAVTIPAIKSGSNMTFSFAAIPASYGFGANGSTFNPTILLSGTTNDIMGSGLQ